MIGDKRIRSEPVFFIFDFAAVMQKINQYISIAEKEYRMNQLKRRVHRMIQIHEAMIDFVKEKNFDVT